MSRVNVNELMNLETTWRMQVKQAEREEKKIASNIKNEKAKAGKRMAEGKAQLAEMHVVRTLELETESANNQTRQVELQRLVTQVQSYRQNVQRAQAMSQATKGMSNLERQMDLGRLTQIMDEYKEKIGNMEIARGIFNEGSQQSTLAGVKQEDVNRMMGQLADEAGVELRQNLEVNAPTHITPSKSQLTAEEEEATRARLRALREAA